MRTPQPLTDETRQLRRLLREVVALSTLPAVWSGYEPRGIAESLADVLLNTLGLDLLYIQLQDPAGPGVLEVARSRRRPDLAGQTRVIGEALVPFLEAGPADPPATIPDPLGGGTLHVLRLGFGQAEECGLLVAGSRQPGFPTADDRLLLGVSATQAAIVIQRKQAEEVLRRHNERLGLSAEAATHLLTTDDPDAMVRGLFERIKGALGLDTYFNYVVDESGDALRLASYTGIPEATARGIVRLEFGEAICGTVALRCQPWVATFIQQSDDPKARLVKSFGIRAYACHPLLVNGRLLGTLAFASHTRDQFDADELTFLETLCHYATLAYERVRLVRELRDTDRRKDAFLATLAHELRNPLAPIRHAGEILRLQGGPAPEVQWAVDVIDRQMRQLTRLLDDLLDVARITVNRLELRMARIDLAAVLQVAVETARPLIEEHGQEFTATLPPHPVALDGDLTRLAQVIANLLNNAAKYTDRGGHIWLTAEQQGPEAVVTVRDTGIGIPPEMLPRIFEMFAQADRSLERSHSGLGIGLTLARQIVELHGGTLTAQSDGAGTGSAFTVRLPVLPEAAPAPPRTRPARERQVPVAARRILVVDDDRISAASLGKWLTIMGHEIRTAYDGLGAVGAAEAFRPDVVLLDIGLPKLNGYEAARKIRQQPWGQGTVLVALTGWGQEADRQRARDAGFDHHLVKPVDPAVLTRLLTSLSHDTGST
jgi:signal transduction histidine kinase/CheY-like chemotaxis protein